jgi:putative ABC transport system permease protein
MSFLKTSLRFFIKYPGHTAINIAGLSLGFTASLLIFLFVKHELGFDRFHEKNAFIYRIIGEAEMPSGQSFSAPTALGKIAPALKNEIPEIIEAVRIYRYGTSNIDMADKRYTEIKSFYADSGFFDIFSFPLLTGNPKKILTGPFEVVLSASLAQRLFGNESPIGQTIKVNETAHKIVGVAADAPANSSLKYEVILSFASVDRPEYRAIERDGVSFHTYLLFDRNADLHQVIPKVVTFCDTLSAQIFKGSGFSVSNKLQPITKTHLYPAGSFEPEPPGSRTNVLFFSVLSILILLIAVINYVNLFTAQGMLRNKEIGVKKTLGAIRSQLIRHFLGESLVITTVALFIALCLTELLRGPFSLMLGFTPDPVIMKPGIFLFTLAAALFTGILAGLYPAFYLSALNPIHAIKGSPVTQGRGKNIFQKILITAQLSATILLVICIGVMNRQMKFLERKNLGFQPENVLVLKNLTGPTWLAYPQIKNELLQNPGILSVSASQSLPGKNRSVQSAYIDGQSADQSIQIHENRVQPDYLQTLGISLIEGKDFDAFSIADSQSVILNQTAVRMLGLEDPIGKKIWVWKRKTTIAGVVEDYHFFSLHSPIEPLALTRYSRYFSYIIIRIGENIPVQETLDLLTGILAKADSHYTPDYFFLDNSLQQLYQAERRSSRLMAFGTLLAFAIALFGLLALTSFLTLRKVKEVGIRKTLGASRLSILWLTTLPLLRLCLISFLIAAPGAFLIMNAWMAKFSYQAPYPWFVFPLSFILISLLSAATATFAGFWLIRLNPADAIRHE